MALVFVDGFDNYGTATNMARGRWDMKTNATFEEVTGRFGGKAAALTRGVNLNLGSNLTTMIFGFGLKMTSAGSPEITTIEVVDASLSKISCSITWASGTVELSVRTGASSTTVLATSLPGVVNLNSWCYFEFKVIIDDAVGVAIARINGAVVATYSGDTNRYLNAYANVLSISAPSATAVIADGGRLYIDDFYFCDGTTGAGTRANNDFLGDKRVATMYPASDSAVQWTPLASVYRAAEGTGGATCTISANRLYLPGFSAAYSYDSPLSGTAFYANQDCTITSITLTALTNTPSIHIRPVVYTEDPLNTDKPSGKLTLGDEMTGLASGINTAPFGTGAVALTKGTKYWVGFIADAGVSLDGRAGTPPDRWKYVSATYPTAPTKFDWAAATVIAVNPMVGYTITAQNYGMVQESNPDSITYNYTDTLNDQDLFTVGPALSTSAVVFAVQVSGSYKKDDANTRKVANLLKSNVTTSQGTELALNADFALTSDIFPTDPDTTTDWTVAGVNAALIGYKVTV